MNNNNMLQDDTARFYASFMSLIMSNITLSKKHYLHPFSVSAMCHMLGISQEAFASLLESINHLHINAESQFAYDGSLITIRNTHISKKLQISDIATLDPETASQTFVQTPFICDDFERFLKNKSNDSYVDKLALPLIIDKSETIYTVKESVYTADIPFAAINDIVKTLTSAINAKRKVMIQYTPRSNNIDAIPPFLVCPLKIVQDYVSGNLYVMTLRVDASVFKQINPDTEDLNSPVVPWRIDRILSCSESEHTFSIETEQGASDVLAKTSSIWGMNYDIANGPVHVRVYFQNTGHIWAKVRKDLTPYINGSAEDKLTTYRNMLCYEDDIYGYDSFKQYIMSYGKSAYVAEIRSSRKDLRADLLKAAQERYAYYSVQEGE